MRAAGEFLDQYYEDLSRLEKGAAEAYWKAANTGSAQDFDTYARLQTELKQLHSDRARYARLKALLERGDALSPTTRRSLEVAQLAFRENQMDPALIAKLVKSASDIEQVFNTFRITVKGKTLTNNDALERMAAETNSAKREELWKALKAVAPQVAPKLVDLARMRNEAARSMGFANYWDMAIRLQEHDPATLVALFDDLARATDQPFRNMKARLDAELAGRFRIEPAAMRPWHYDNPFFQEAPPSARVDPSLFFKSRFKEEIVRMGEDFFKDIGLPMEDIVARSDYYERPGKDQHAFCITIDRADDVRTLLNVKPTAEWMDTMLHESGHAVYYKYVDRDLPYNLREAAHIFTTEAIAMLFGALSKNPTWLISYAGVPRDQVAPYADALLEQRQREQLIFARWTLVMFNFEKALYENPEQDLDTLWYDLVERFQLLTRPEGRKAPDWAAKPHFTIAPVYYHNYLLGELFAAQIRNTLARITNFEGPTARMPFAGKPEIGRYLIERIFRPGMSQKWPDFVRAATDHDLGITAFVAEVGHTEPVP